MRRWGKAPALLFRSHTANNTNGFMSAFGSAQQIVNTNPIRGLRFLNNTLTGTITAGTFIVYGIAK